nr:ORF4 [Darna trima granulovirus]
MISILFDNDTVYYNFDELLILMLKCNFERADKKMLICDRLKIVGNNEQVFCTNGNNIDIRLVTHDECFVTFDGVIELIESNTFGDKEKLESYIVACTSRVVLNPTHSWINNYTERIRARINGSFDFYFKVLEQYMLANQPQVDKIGSMVNRLIVTAEHYKRCDDYNMLLQACQAFDTASALMLKQIK